MSCYFFVQFLLYIEMIRKMGFKINTKLISKLYVFLGEFRTLNMASVTFCSKQSHFQNIKASYY